MRARNLKPGFFKNEALCELHPHARLLFQGLWCLADREGRLEDRPKRIRAEVMPYDNVDADALLTELHAAGFIVRYVGRDGARYIQVVNFLKHQNPHANESKSVIPEPLTATFPPRVEGLRSKEESASLLILDPSSLNPSSLSVSSEPPSAAPEPPTDDPLYLEYNTVGKAKVWELRKSYLDELHKLYGKQLNVLAECRKAKLWLEANPNRRKTAHGMKGFLVNWLNRACDTGKGFKPLPPAQAKAEAEQQRRAMEAKRRPKVEMASAIGDILAHAQT